MIINLKWFNSEHNYKSEDKKLILLLLYSYLLDIGYISYNQLKDRLSSLRKDNYYFRYKNLSNCKLFKKALYTPNNCIITELLFCCKYIIKQPVDTNGDLNVSADTFAQVLKLYYINSTNHKIIKFAIEPIISLVEALRCNLKEREMYYEIKELAETSKKYGTGYIVSRNYHVGPEYKEPDVFEFNDRLLNYHDSLMIVLNAALENLKPKTYEYQLENYIKHSIKNTNLKQWVRAIKNSASGN